MTELFLLAIVVQTVALVAFVYIQSKQSEVWIKALMSKNVQEFKEATMPIVKTVLQEEPHFTPMEELNEHDFEKIIKSQL